MTAPVASLLAAVDAAGAKHLATLPAGERRRHGVFYTPADLAAQLVDAAFAEVPAGRPLSACEPACGAGAFAVPLAQALRERPGSELTLADRDPSAVEIARGLAEQVGGVRVRAVVGDALADAAPAVWRRHDIVAGNPPFAAAPRGLPLPARNLAAGFLARAVESLAPDGVLCFVLPRPLAYIARWRPVRDLLWREGRIEQVVEIHRTIDVGMEQIGLVFRRAPAAIGHVVRVRAAGPTGLVPRHEVPAILSRGPTLAVSMDRLARRVVAAVERRSVPLASAHPRVFRGLIVQRHLSPARNGESRWIGRREIDHYAFTGEPRTLPEGVARAVAERAGRQEGVKILAQRRVSRKVHPHHLVTRAALDLAGDLRAVDTALVVRIEDEAARWLALLVLNSALGAYFLEKVAFDGNTRTTPDLDREYLLRLFLPDVRGEPLTRMIDAARRGDRPRGDQLLGEHFDLPPDLLRRAGGG